MLIRKLLLLTFSTALSLLLAELGFRLYGPDLNPNQLWRHDADLGWVNEMSTDRISHVNSHGFRSPPMTEKSPGTKRLLILGDSFSVGSAEAYRVTFAGRLAQWLGGGEAGNWEIHSLAVADWGTAQQLLALRKYRSAYRPDFVVIQVFPFNDLCNNSPEMADTCSLQDHHRPYLLPAGNGELKLHYREGWLGHLRRYSILLGYFLDRRVAGQRNTLGLDFGNPRDQNLYFRSRTQQLGMNLTGALVSLLPEKKQLPVVKRAWLRTEAILAKLVQELRQDNIPVTALVVPYVRTFQPYWASYGKNLQQLEPDYGTSRTEEFLTRLGIPVISLRKRIEATPMDPGDFFLMPQDSHLNFYGHARVAKWIISEMQSQELVPKLALLPRSSRFDLLDIDQAQATITGVDPIEVHPDGQRRCGLNAATVIAFFRQQPAAARLTTRFESTVKDQKVNLLINGQRVRSTALQLGESSEFEMDFDTLQGRNEIRFEFASWVGKEGSLPPLARPRAVCFQELEIRSLAEDPRSFGTDPNQQVHQ